MNNNTILSVIEKIKQRNAANIDKMIQNNICNLVAYRLNKTAVTLKEVDDLYNSGAYPEINKEIDYIING